MRLCNLMRKEGWYGSEPRGRGRMLRGANETEFWRRV